VTVNDVNTFPQSDGSQVREERKEVWEGGRGSYCGEWYMIHLEAWGQPSYTHSVRRMTVADDNDLYRGGENTVD